MTNLTRSARRALTILEHRSAIVRGPGHQLGDHDITYITAERLVIAGLARPTPADDPDNCPLGALVITTAGRKALATPIDQPPRLLRARITATPYTDRVHEAVRDEGECIDAELLAHYTRDAHERHDQRPGRREELLRRRLRTLGDQARRVLDRDGDLPTEVIEQIEQIQQHLDVINRRDAA